jgi:hypothetical protein
MEAVQIECGSILATHTSYLGDRPPDTGYVEDVRILQRLPIMHTYSSPTAASRTALGLVFM